MQHRSGYRHNDVTRVPGQRAGSGCRFTRRGDLDGMTGGRRRPSQPVACDGPDWPVEGGIRNAPCGHPGRRHRAGGHRRGAEGPRRRSRPAPRPPTTTSGAARWHSTGELLPESVLTELQRARRDPARRGRRPVGARAASSSAACCCGCGSSSTTTSTCAPPGSTPACAARSAGNPEIDMVVVREGTEGPYVGTGGLLRKDTPHEIATEVPAQHRVRRRAGGARRVRAAPSAAPASTSRWCTRRTC